MEILPLKTGILQKGFNLIEKIQQVLVKNQLKLQEGDILIISSKIIAVSENRIVDLKTIKASRRAKNFKRTRYGRGKEDPRIIELILREADAVMPGQMILTWKNNSLIPEAGIDLSNIPKGFAVLWPKNPQKQARAIWKQLKEKFKLKNFGVLICDSHCQPMRWGVTGLGVAWAGFEGIEDARGQKDIYGKPLKHTRKAIADNLASAALILMGEAGEKIPFVIARNSPVKFTNKPQGGKETAIKPKQCIFSGIYNKKFLRLLA